KAFREIDPGYNSDVSVSRREEVREMKVIIPAVLVVAVSGTGFGQNAPVSAAPGIYNAGALKPSNQRHVFAGPEEFRLEIVRRLMPGPTSRPTTGSVQLHRMGDEAAVDIIKILGEGTPLRATGHSRYWVSSTRRSSIPSQ
ncbi:MAG: hypothetical protein ACRD9L_02400, partial [Bryobacteraceae bacterium]